VGQLGLGSGLLGQLIFESALERQMVGIELREVALERRDRRFRARPGFGLSAFSRNLQDQFESGNLFSRVRPGLFGTAFIRVLPAAPFLSSRAPASVLWFARAAWQLAEGSVGRDVARRGSVGRSRLQGSKLGSQRRQILLKCGNHCPQIAVGNWGRGRGDGRYWAHRRFGHSDITDFLSSKRHM
jgi:hypothetical protein